MSDLKTDLAVAFLVEKRFEDTMESNEAAAIINRVKNLLEAASDASLDQTEEGNSSFAAH